MFLLVMAGMGLLASWNKPKPIHVVGYEDISFETLAGRYTGPTFFSLQATKSQDPEEKITTEARLFNGKKVSIVGYMVPLSINDEKKITSFMLVRSLGSCCFGGAPGPNELVQVTMNDTKTSDYFGMNAVLVSGTLDVGARTDGKASSSLYRMAADLVQKV